MDIGIRAFELYSRGVRRTKIKYINNPTIKKLIAELIGPGYFFGNGGGLRVELSLLTLCPLENSDIVPLAIPLKITELSEKLKPDRCEPCVEVSLSLTPTSKMDFTLLT